MVSLAGLGGLASGLSQGFLTAEQVAQKRREQQLALQGQDIAGNALLGNPGSQTGLPGPGAMPGNAPQPGQASVPMQQPMPGAQPMPGVQQSQPQQPQAQAPQQGQQTPQFDLPTLVQLIKQKNPRITGPQMMAAVQALTPLLSMQGQMQYRQAMIQLSQQRANTGDLNANIHQQSVDQSGQMQQQRLELAQQQFQLAKQKADDANLRFEQNRNDTQAYRTKVLADRDLDEARKLIGTLGATDPTSLQDPGTSWSGTPRPPTPNQSLVQGAKTKLQQPSDPYKVPPKLAPQPSAQPASAGPTHVQTQAITPPPAQAQPDPIAEVLAKAKAAIAAGAPRHRIFSPTRRSGSTASS